MSRALQLFFHFTSILSNSPGRRVPSWLSYHAKESYNLVSVREMGGKRPQGVGALEVDTRTASSVPIYMYGFVDTNSHLAKKKN